MMERTIIDSWARYEGGYFGHDKKTPVEGQLCLTDQRLVFNMLHYWRIRHPLELCFTIPVERLIHCQSFAYTEVHRGKFIYAYRRGKILVLCTDERDVRNTLVFDVGYHPSDEIWQDKVNGAIAFTKQGRAKRVSEVPIWLVKNVEAGYYGAILLKTKLGQYWGGHTGHKMGKKMALDGRMYLTEDYLLFAESPKDNYFSSKTIESACAFGIPLASLSSPIKVQTEKGFFWGKAHLLVLPYTEEDGTQQQPRFRISSFWPDSKKISERWANVINKRIMEI